jgi:DNA-binding winged helix-turn-helix (wHTH) protein
MTQQTQRIFEFGEYRFEAGERLLKRGDEVVPLPPKAIELLTVLLESGGRVMSKEELMGLVWADAFVEEANLSHNIFLLRKALTDSKNGSKFIETSPRRGYRFVANVLQSNETPNLTIAHERTISHIVVEEEIEIFEGVFIVDI